MSLLLKSKVRAILIGTAWVWLMLVTAGQYHLATDPEYDSVAPAMSIVAGWLPGLIYSLLCVLLVTISGRGLQAIKARRHRDG